LHARRSPTAVAVANGDTYRSLALNVLRIMDALGAAGIHGGQVVGVETSDRYLHLLILLAAEALAVTTISLERAELEPPVDLGRLCDRVMVSAPVASLDPAKTLDMTLDWIVYALSRPMTDARLADLERPLAPGTLVRLIRSSGTTGLPKVMRVTHRVRQHVVQMNLIVLAPRIARHPNYLCLYNFTIRAAHTRALVTLRLGGTIHLVGGDDLWDAILAGKGNYALFVTGDLERFVRSAPRGRGPFDLHIGVMGSAVSRRLRREIRANITDLVEFSYSCNEVHRISLVDDDNVGTLFPGVHVKIVGQYGEPVPLGSQGRICVKNDTMVDGYADAPELTRATFIDGWFHTDDAGFQPSEGKLVVLGRLDDMLNAGGIKLAPGPIEERLRTLDGIRDALVTAVDDGLETGTVLVAIETGLAEADVHLLDLIAPIVREYATRFESIALPVFPRTETGKIRRDEIKKLYRRNPGSR
jgi:acyl-CoA synthetase (AMP-forming)/AMP-acid ligase II